MQSDDPAFIAPAMAVISMYDRPLFDRMMAEDWMVHVVHPGEEHSLPEPARSDLVGAEAITHPHLPVTYLSVKSIAADSAFSGVPVAKTTASTLVHEYAHIRDTDRAADARTELIAYSAELRFDRKVGDPALYEVTSDIAYAALTGSQG